MGVPDQVITEAMAGFRKALLKDELDYMTKQDAIAHIRAKSEYLVRTSSESFDIVFAWRC